MKGRVGKIKERGISTVVASVLVVLLVAVAIVVVWLVVLPMIDEGTRLERSNVRLEIITEGGYTFCDPATEILHIQVKRGTDKADLTSLIFLVIINGNSISYSTDRGGESWTVPAPNEEKTYLLNVSKFIHGACDVIDSVSIIPVFSDGTEGTAKYSLGEGIKGGSSPTPDSDKFQSSNSDSQKRVPGVLWISLTNCSVLNESGNYRFDEDLVVDELSDYDSNAESYLDDKECFLITADDVVVDMNGNTLSSTLCVDDEEYCVSAFVSKDVSNFKLSNGVIDGFGGSVRMEGGSGGEVLGLTIRNGRDGVYVNNVDGALISDIDIEDLSFRPEICFGGGFFGGIPMCSNIPIARAINLNGSKNVRVENIFSDNVSVCVYLRYGDGNLISGFDGYCEYSGMDIMYEDNLEISNSVFNITDYGGGIIGPLINLARGNIYASYGMVFDNVVAGPTKIYNSHINISDSMFCGSYAEPVGGNGMGPPFVYYGLHKQSSSIIDATSVSCTNNETNPYCDSNNCPEIEPVDCNENPTHPSCLMGPFFP